MGLDLSKYKFVKGGKAAKIDAVKTRKEKPKFKGYTELTSWKGPLKPILREGLDIVFVGSNPGLESARTKHHYAHHSNKFYKLLFWSNLTPCLCRPEQDTEFPALFNYGFTDLVHRATRSTTDLSKEEMQLAVHDLISRLTEVNPKIVCLVGKIIWTNIATALQWDKKKFEFGIDKAHKLGDSALCVVPSTSGLNTISTSDQLEAWTSVYECLTSTNAN